MTASAADVADRRDRASERPHRAQAAASAILLLLLAGLALRLIIAYVLFPGSGFESDIATFQAWALDLASKGPAAYYETAGFADYPPGYLYVLWLLGELGGVVAGPLGTDAATATVHLLKLPAMLADLGIAYLLYRFARNWLGGHPHALRYGLGAAALYLFNPVTWYDSALWGQVDSIGALVMLAGVGLLIRGHSEAAAVAAVVAGLVKPQFGVVLGPLVAVVLLRRHLLRPGSGPRPTGLPRALHRRLVDDQGPLRLVTSAVAALAVLSLLLAPFGLHVVSFVELVGRAAGTYNYLTVNAYNLWAFVGADGNAPHAISGLWSWDSCTPENLVEGCEATLIGPLNGVMIGTVLLALGFAYGLARVLRSDDRRSILLAAAFLSFAFFMLPTRVHERYMFPVFAFLPLLAIGSRRWFLVTVVLSVATMINLHGILTHPTYATASVERLPLGDLFRSSTGDNKWFPSIAVLLNLAVFAFAAWRIRPGAPPAEALEPTVPPNGHRATGIASVSPPGSVPGLASGSPAEGGVPGSDLASDLSPDPSDPHRPRAMALGTGVGTASVAARAPSRGFVQRLLRVRVRPDRSAVLAGEPPGRFGRLDLFMVVVVFLSAMTLRTWRLAEPYDMHFDEVYHARTAAEFLQHWRYDDPHDIYEYTHPHLAKYLIGAGMIAAGDNEVKGRTDLGVPVAAAAIERRWSPEEAPAERNGDRLYVLTGTELRAYDLRDRALVATIATTATALALDEAGHQLYLTEPGGALTSLETGALDELRSDPAAALPSPTAVGEFEGVVGDVLSLAVANDGASVVATLSSDTVVSMDPETGAQTFLDLPGAAEIQPLRDRDDEARIAVAAEQGIVILDPVTLEERQHIDLDGPATGLSMLETGLEDATLYVATGEQVEFVRVPDDAAAERTGEQRMPGPVTDTLWNPASELVHVVGRTPDGSASTIYVIEPRGNAVFADARLPFDPRAVVFDAQPDLPSDDRQEILALAGDGSVATVNAGSNAFGWRISGVIAGALMAVLLYLLGRILFRRRSVAVIASLLALADGMFFANSRIAMNDTYVSLFIVAAFTLFAPLYLGLLRGRLSVLLGFPLLGVLLGLALAAKWVGAYAIGGIVLLILLRSALGRSIALAGMVVLTGVLGFLAVSTGAESEAGERNIVFLLVMLALTVALAVLMVLRPVRLSRDEVRFVTVASAVLGVVAVGVAVAAPTLAPGSLPENGLLSPGRLLLVGSALLLLAAVVHFGASLLGRRGAGPLAAPEPGVDHASPAPQGWLRPGWALGVPWLWALGCLAVVPLVVYGLSYIPWIALGNHWDLPLLAAGPSPPGEGFLDLQGRMYSYHNELRTAHAASSPWWAWPFDLKPVWFYQNDFANGTTGAIYDAGNLVVFWLGVPAVAWTAYQAWKRRSLSLTLIVLAIAALWLPWARIDRATFQYHVFTSLPFTVLALAYFVAELWHGPSRRTWLYARVAAALAIVAAPLLWIARAPLCELANTSKVNPNGQACGEVSERAVITSTDVISVLIVAAGVALFVLQLRRWTRARAGDPGDATGSGGVPIGAIVAIGGTAVALLLVQVLLPRVAVFEGQLGLFGPYVLAALLLIPLAILAALVLFARDARRFAIGVVGAAGLWFVLWYPHISGLPLPTPVVQKYLLALPTYNYDFQFGVNTDDPYKGGILDPKMFVLLAGVVLVTACAMYAAAAWREVLAARGDRDHSLDATG